MIILDFDWILCRDVLHRDILHSRHNATPSAKTWEASGRLNNQIMSADRPRRFGHNLRLCSAHFTAADFERLLDHLGLIWYGLVDPIATISWQKLTCKQSMFCSHDVQCRWRHRHCRICRHIFFISDSAISLTNNKTPLRTEVDNHFFSFVAVDQHFKTQDNQRLLEVSIST